MTAINDQWELTDDSLKGRGDVSYYEIPATQLTASGDSPFPNELYNWPIHMAQKINFNYEQFADAFRAALDKFADQLDPPVDQNMLEASIVRGKEFDADT